jgi:hypothetical protein
MPTSITGPLGIGVAPSTAFVQVRKDQNALTVVRADNLTTGNAAQAAFLAGNDTGDVMEAGVGSSTFTTYGALLAREAFVYTASIGLTCMVDNANGIIKFATGGNTERMQIDKDGQVGIGTGAPGTFVDIRKDQNASTTVRLLNLTAGTGAQTAFSSLNDTFDSIQIGVLSSTFTTNGALVARRADIYSSTTLAIIVDNGSGFIVFATGGTAEKMRLSAAGGLSIGDSTDPGAGGNRWTGETQLPPGSVAVSLGNNNDLAIPATTLIKLTDGGGGAGVRVITGFANGVDGRVILLFNDTSNSVIITGADTNSVAANRIITSAAAGTTIYSFSNTNGESVAQFVYSSALGGWMLS